MINDIMYNKFNFFINHFHQLAESFIQMSYSVDDTLEGFKAFLKWESKERYKTYEYLVERLMFISKKVNLESLPKPRNTFANITEIMTYAVDLEKTTVNAINAAIGEAIQNYDYFCEIEFKKIFCEELMQYKENEDLLKKITKFTDMNSILEINEELYEEFYDK
jgi:ferritin